MGTGTTFHNCCIKAIKDHGATGYDCITSPSTIESWNRYFRNHENFACPTSKKLEEPFLFETFPVVRKNLLEWAFNNMAVLSVCTFRQHLVNVILPDLDKGRSREEYCELQLSLLDETLTNPPLETTIGRWMKNLGFAYDSHKKTFYVDGHEKEEQRISRLEFSQKYLTKLEPYMRRWIQAEESEVDFWISKKYIHPRHKEAGYRYLGDDGNWMYEFHVDTCDFIYETYAGRDGLYRYGGFPSVRREDKSRKPLIIFGQDECIFNQYLAKVGTVSQSFY